MTYNIETRNLFLAHYYEGKSLSQISKLLIISYKTLLNWEFMYREEILDKVFLTSDHLKKYKKVHGLSKSHLYEQTIVDFVYQNHGSRLDQIQEHINNKLSQPVISRVLQRNDITRKKFKTQIYPQDINVINQNRSDFAASVNESEFLNYISIDESSFCIDDYYRYGYSPKGIEFQRILIYKFLSEGRSIWKIK